ncbi:MAG: SbcC/MukB-like Walker B domain-containing protein, partial [Myxococcota bacterium]|nr:SbcC/MukB-like Walker B domain-containing protein [Myxococcota bacterium]
MEAYGEARRDKETMGALRSVVQGYDKACVEVATRVKLAEGNAKGLEAPDLETLSKAAAEARLALDAHIQGQGELLKEHKVQVGRVETLARLAKDREAQDKAFQVMGRLTEVARGDNKARLTFERYVLAAMLDEVLTISNEHLGRMTGGRYQLKRADDPKDRRSKAGLDLEVSDTYTGQTRSASTLSGGEGFEASLSMALGLSDHVKGFSGGVHLDAIFVDEGFGTLGPEDLDAVMTLLHELQADGRLVGVISHVDRLKDRIHTRLEVEKGSTGSTARFVLP